MKHVFYILLLLTIFTACESSYEEPQAVTFPAPRGTFANPERGFKVLTYFEHAPFGNRPTVGALNVLRKKSDITLHQHVYYLTDFISSDVSQTYLDAFDANMQVLREAGCKCILRFAYKHSEAEDNKPWDATPEWSLRHLEQFKPYLQKNADVIFCFEAGFVGVWGEWWYTTGYPMAPTTKEQIEPRVRLLDAMLDAIPDSRQVLVRTPQYKSWYLDYYHLPFEPMDVTVAHTDFGPARIGAFNDCFISSSDDVGTYRNSADREFWAGDTKYTIVGGEICANCAYTDALNAIAQMEKYHFTYCNDGEWHNNQAKWKAQGYWETICERMGYRIVLDSATYEERLRKGMFSLNLTLHNEGFAAPQNPRDVELVFKNADTAYVFPQYNIDPRFWMPNDPVTITLRADMSDKPKGEYMVYLNLPDPCESIHNDPRYSIRCANIGVWFEQLGYNRLFSINLQ